MAARAKSVSGPKARARPKASPLRNAALLDEATHEDGDRAAALLRGQRLTDDRIADAAAAAAEIAKPMDNTDFELVWRKTMVRTLVSSALHEIRGDDMRARRRQLARQELLTV